MSAAEAERIEAMAVDALQVVKRTPMSGLSRVTCLLVLDAAFAKASRLRRSAIAAGTQCDETAKHGSVPEGCHSGPKASPKVSR